MGTRGNAPPSRVRPASFVGAMPGLHKWLLALSAALLISGAGGVLTHSRSSQRDPVSAPVPVRSTASSSSLPPAPASPTTLVPAPAVPPGEPADSATLAAGMITPTDMGGYYRIDSSAAATILHSAPCLAGLTSSSADTGRADTALLGPDYHSVPTIVEVVASYSGQQPAAVYRAVVAAVDACPSFAVNFGGTALGVPLRRITIPAVGLASTAWAGTVPFAGSNLELQVGVVLDGHSVVALMWIDSVPPSAAVMGDFTSTLSVALGKLA